MHLPFRSLASKALVIVKVQSAHAPAFAATRCATQYNLLLRECLRSHTPSEAAWASHRPLPKGKQAKLALTTSAERLRLRPCLSPEYGTTLCRSLRTGQSHQTVLPDQQQQVVPGIKAQIPPPVTNIRQRIVGYLRESLLLSYTALFDNVVFSTFEWLQLDKGLKLLTPRLEDGYASLTGKWYTLADGQRRSISLVNHTAFDFSIPQQYKTADFPFDSSPETATHVAKTSQHGCTFDLPSLYRAHMLSLCMKLVYEKHEVIDDIASRYLGCKLQGYFLTSDKQTKQQRHKAKASKQAEKPSKAAFVPRTLAIMLTTPKAVVMAFRGTEPTNLINMRSSGKISMSHPEGMGGVHDGFWTALMYESEEQGGASLFDRLVEALQAGDQTLGIHLTGHSLGGALAAVFAQALVARGHKELAQRVRGVHTFGGPRIGDAEFCTLLGQQFPGGAFRYVHGADIIPKIPPRFLLYDHFPREIYLSSFGQLVLETRDIARWHKIEAWGYLPIQLYKTVGNLIRLKESPIRTMYRLALLLTVPGLSDHFPQDYEQLLRNQVTSSAVSHAPLIWSRHMLDDKFSRVQHIVTRV